MRSGTDGESPRAPAGGGAVLADAAGLCGCADSRKAMLRLDRAQARLKAALKRRALLERFLVVELQRELTGIARLATTNAHPALASEPVASHLQRVADLLRLTAEKCAAGGQGRPQP